MKTLNLKELKVYTSINKTHSEILDVTDTITDAMWNHASSIALGALTIRLYENKGICEINENEERAFIDFIDKILTIRLTDAIKEQLK